MTPSTRTLLLVLFAFGGTTGSVALFGKKGGKDGQKDAEHDAEATSGYDPAKGSEKRSTSSSNAAPSSQYVDTWPTRPPSIIEAEARTARELSVAVRTLNRDLDECTERVGAIESGFQKLYAAHLGNVDGLRKCKEGLLSAADLDDLESKLDAVPGVSSALMEQAKHKNDQKKRADHLEDLGFKHKELIVNLEQQVEKLMRREKTWERTISELVARRDLLENRESAWERTIGDLMGDIEVREKKEAFWEQMKQDMERRIGLLSHIAVVERYGPGPHYVRMNVLLEYNKPESQRSIVFELAPLDLMPHSIHTFLSQITEGYWKRGTPAFAINAEHVLQACPHPCLDSVYLGGDMVGDPYADMRSRGIATVSYQEYSPKYPHEKYTIGYAGHPLSGPEFYINLLDNSLDHGSLQDRKMKMGREYDEWVRHTFDGIDDEDIDQEPYPCFGKVVEGFETIDLMAEGMTRASLPDAEYTDSDLLLRPIAIVELEIIPEYIERREGEGAASAKSTDEL